MDVAISIVSLVGFILLTGSTGLFVAIEFALTGVERSTVEAHVRDKGDRPARAVAHAQQNLSFVLSGAQLGITVTTLATGFLAEPVLSRFFTPVLQLLGLPAEASSTVALILALVVATTLSMVFGELVPKNLAITMPLATGRWVVRPVGWFNAVFKPFIKAMNTSANWVVRRMGIEPADELASARSSQELGSLVRNSAESGGIEPATAGMLDRSLRFGTTTAEEFMTPRSKVESLREHDTVSDLIALALETGHSRFPVVRGDLDDTIGVVHIKDAFSVPQARRSTMQLSALAKPVSFVPDTLDGDAVLTKVRGAGSQVVLIADEYGGTAGLVTIEDVVEEILGEVYDEHDEPANEQDFLPFGNSWEISGLARLEELDTQIDYRAPDGPYETLGGLIMATLGRIAAVDDVAVLVSEDQRYWLARISVMDDRRIDKVIVTPVSAEEAKEYL